MNTRKAVFYFLMISHTAMLIWMLYSLWTGETPALLGVIYVAGTLYLIRNYALIYQRYSPVDIGPSIEIPIQLSSDSNVTLELISKIVRDDSVAALIRDDLAKTSQIGHKEVWRFGLITPDQDRYNPNPDPAPLHTRLGRIVTDYNYRLQSIEQIPLKRTAVLHNTTYFNQQFNNLFVTGGSIEPMMPTCPVRSYRLSTKLKRGESVKLRNIQVENRPGSLRCRSKYISDFLREDGFPLKSSYSDGDPLTTDRGGTIVMDRGNVMVIYPRYFVQRRLIDDEGNLVDVGIDEDFGHHTKFEVLMRPSVSRLLIQGVSIKGYVPVVRYRSFPYASDFMLPLLDTPMSANGWADLHVDSRGKAKLFVAKDKTEAEWYQMMSRLRRLFYSALAKKDYHLLALTKDKTHLNEYLLQKQVILQDYFIIQDFALPGC